ncbi:MAG TPA: hypothetical protein VJQ54_14830 [Candidatus Sulfotelmatobacter sp.]|nr:hypothetical protein [Candidatus Sulfotelmatobacter sp.]
MRLLRAYCRPAVLLALLSITVVFLDNSAPAQISVTSALPNSAAQGTINLNVTVGGKGFKAGAKAQWFISGTTNPGGVTVNSTAFVNSNNLTANITVSSTATVGGFDIVVTNTDGRSGKGSELFAVQGPSCNYNVTSVLYDTDSNSVPYQYQSDGLGPYTTFNKGNNSVSSIIQRSCSWDLDTTGSTTRGIVLTLAYPDSSGSPPFVGTQEIHGVFHTECFNNSANNNVNFGTMTSVGQILACPMHFVFAYNGVTYNLALAPPTWPGTSYMQVTCTGASGGQCNQWTVQPDPNTSFINPSTNQLSGIAELFLPSSSGSGTGTPIGEFYVSFSFLIHK